MQEIYFVKYLWAKTKLYWCFRLYYFAQNNFQIHSWKQMIASIKYFFINLNILAEFNSRGTRSPITNHHNISVGRWAPTIILENHIINEKIMNRIQIRIYFLFLYLSHRRSNHIANHIDIAAWSDGNELLGKYLCKIVSKFSCHHKTEMGLCLSKKVWKNIFTAVDKIAHRKTRKADSLNDFSFLISQTR